jgi:hypothetical protein
MNHAAISVIALTLCFSISGASAQEMKPLEGDSEVFVLQLPKGEQDVLPKLNEILKGKDNYRLFMGTNLDIYSATTGTSGGGDAGRATEFVDPLGGRLSTGAILTKTEEVEIIQLCVTNAKPASYGICRKYKITASAIDSAGGN